MIQILAEGPSGEIVVLEAEAFELEAKLQRLIEEHPEIVLAGTTDNVDIRIWTIGFEVPTDAGSIDLLLLDSDGSLWVVETKLAKNPEIKKQVVGQVLGYASCVAEWTSDTINAIGTEYLAEREASGSLVEFLALELGDENAAGELLKRAEERAAAGDIRALIVVDELPATLRRLVEFVNNHAEFDLLALKVEVTTHRDGRLFIPTVVGVTGAKEARKKPSGDVYELIEQSPEAVKELWLRLQQLVEERGWAYEPAAKSIKVVDEDGGFVVRIWPTYRTLELILGTIEDAGMAEKAEEIRNQLSDLVGTRLSARNPSPSASKLLPVWDAFVDRVLPEYWEARRAAKQLTAGGADDEATDARSQSRSRPEGREALDELTRASERLGLYEEGS